MKRSARGSPVAGASTILLACALAFGGCGRGTNHAEEEATNGEAANGERSPADSNRVELSPGSAERAGIRVQPAQPATIEVTVEVPGEVKPDSLRVLVVRPRFPGVVRTMRKQIGDPVRRGETVSTIQSNESLTDYAVVSGMSGRVVARGASPGTTVSTDSPLYTIVNLADVWVEFAIYPHQIGQIRRGQQAEVLGQSGSGPRSNGVVSYVGPLLAEDTRVSVGRIVLSNQSGMWEPGLFVTVRVAVDRAAVPVAVPDEAIVRMDQGSAVFVARRGGFELVRVVPGRSDGRLTQVVSGVASGDSVVVHNAFVLKAELEKAEFEE